MIDTPTRRLRAALDALHPSAHYVRVEAIDLRAALDAARNWQAAPDADRLAEVIDEALKALQAEIHLNGTYHFGEVKTADLAASILARLPAAPTPEPYERLDCPVGIHHGPGHQSTTRCYIEEPHEVHEATFGEWQQTARWRGGDIFSGVLDYDDAPDEDRDPTYVSDASWYQRTPENLDRYPPKEYRDPRLPEVSA